MEQIQKNPSVAVIGAGLAGLTAAFRLQRLGYNVDVYEARKRPGGRVYTAYFEKGYEELGGKSLNDGGDASYIKALIKELGMEIENSMMLIQNVYLDSEDVVAFSSLFDHIKAPDQNLHEQLMLCKEKSNNLGEVIDKFLSDNAILCKLMHKMMMNYEGSNTYKLTKDYAEQFWEFYQSSYGHSKEKTVPIRGLSWIKGGNSCFVYLLTAQLGDHIHYHSVLHRIKKKEGKFEIYFQDGKIVTADFVVMAIPCSTLKDVNLQDCEIPQDQLEAINKLQYGTNSKMLLPVKFSHEDQPKTCFSKNGATWFNADLSIMTCYSGGEAGVFSMKDKSFLQQVMTRELPSLKALYPTINFPDGTDLESPGEELFPFFSNPVAISWDQEEFSKGSYSNWSADDGDLFSTTSFVNGHKVRTVFRPVDSKLFFAGEHTSIENPASMEGAVESGELVARLLHSEQKK